MRRSVVLPVAAVGACLALGLSAWSAQRVTKSSGGARPGVIPAAGATAPGGGPGFGGRGPMTGVPANFIGVTTQKFPIGVGALAASRECNAEHPVSRLCEWAEIFRALPPVSLDSEVLVAPNYEMNPVTSCLNPMGGLNCRPLAQRLPAACCGFPVPTAGNLSGLILSPSDPQIVASCSDTFVFTAAAFDAQGLPIEGVTVSFDIPPAAGGALPLAGVFTPPYGITGADGTATSALTLDASVCAANCTGSLVCSALVQAHDLSGLVFSNQVPLVDQIP